jgi:hypothetical protein
VITGQRYGYRIEEVAPGVAWHEAWPGHVTGARFPYIPYGWRAWACTTGDHRYHRTRAAVYRCAGMLNPRSEPLQILAGEVDRRG